MIKDREEIIIHPNPIYNFGTDPLNLQKITDTAALDLLTAAAKTYLSGRSFPTRIEDAFGALCATGLFPTLNGDKAQPLIGTVTFDERIVKREQDFLRRFCNRIKDAVPVFSLWYVSLEDRVVDHQSEVLLTLFHRIVSLQHRENKVPIERLLQSESQFESQGIGLMSALMPRVREDFSTFFHNLIGLVESEIRGLEALDRERIQMADQGLTRDLFNAYPLFAQLAEIRSLGKNVIGLCKAQPNRVTPKIARQTTSRNRALLITSIEPDSLSENCRALLLFAFLKGVHHQLQAGGILHQAESAPFIWGIQTGAQRADHKRQMAAWTQQARNDQITLLKRNNGEALRERVSGNPTGEILYAVNRLLDAEADFLASPEELLKREVVREVVTPLRTIPFESLRSATADLSNRGIIGENVQCALLGIFAIFENKQQERLRASQNELGELLREAMGWGEEIVEGICATAPADRILDAIGLIEGKLVGSWLNARAQIFLATFPDLTTWPLNELDRYLDSVTRLPSILRGTIELHEIQTRVFQDDLGCLAPDQLKQLLTAFARE